MNRIFNKHQFVEAREFLKDAEILKRYDSPVERSTTYSKGGKKYYEYWCKLEYPENEYYVVALDEAVQ